MDEQRAKQEVEKQGQPNALVLCRSSVWEGVLPERFDREFQEFEQNGKGRTQLTSTTSPQRAGSASTSARQRLERRPDCTSLPSQKWLQRQQAESRRLSRAAFNERCTPSARQEAEEAERLRWLQALPFLVERSPTPMGNLLARQPGSLALLGAGRRAATLRNRVRLLRNCFSWLTARTKFFTPLHWSTFVGFLRARASEPANVGALRNVNRTFTFLHEVTGTEQANRLTATPLYDAVYREILTSCEPGRPVKQAPRFPVGLLALVENLVTTNSNPAYMRMYGWWHDAFLRPPWLVSSRHHSQRWESDRALEGGRRGTHKNVSARPVRVDASSFISSPQWLSAGWQILNELAPFQRDHLLPAPAGLYDSCLRMEFRYALVYAIQNRLLASLVDSKGAKVLTAEATVFWTPHSGRSFLLSCTAALGFPREERDYLGGWSPQASDTHARTAKPGISSMQRSVSDVIAQGQKETGSESRKA